MKKSLIASIWKKLTGPKIVNPAIPCFVYTDEHGKDGTIYCHVRNPGLIKKVDRRFYYVEVGNSTRQFLKSRVEIPG